jgi:hypothetical protein
MRKISVDCKLVRGVADVAPFSVSYGSLMLETWGAGTSVASCLLTPSFCQQL